MIGTCFLNRLPVRAAEAARRHAGTGWPAVARRWRCATVAEDAADAKAGRSALAWVNGRRHLPGRLELAMVLTGHGGCG